MRNASSAPADVRRWLESGCSNPLILWPEETVFFSGSQSLYPNDKVPQDQKPKSMNVRPVRCYRFGGFKFSSHGGWIHRDGPKLESTNIMPSYSDLTMEDDDARNNFKQEKGEDIQQAFILAHNPVEPYGHFLLEMAPKLLVYAKLAEIIPDLPILLPWYVPRYVLDWIQLLANDAPIIRLSKTEHRVVNYSFYCDMLMYQYVTGSAFDAFRGTSFTAARAVSSNQPSERLFISRKARRLSARDFRAWENEAATENLLLNCGFVTIEPEQLTITEQIIVFRAARIVVGELSSALHNTIFCGRGTDIIQINPFNAVQEHLSLSLGHRLVSILPDSGQLSGWPPKDEGQAFTIEPSRVWNALKRLTE